MENETTQENIEVNEKTSNSNTENKQTETKTESKQEQKQETKEEKTFSQEDINKLLAKQKRDFQKQINEIKMAGMSEDEKINFLNSENFKSFKEDKENFEKEKNEFSKRQNKLIAFEKCNQRNLNKESVNLINFDLVKTEKDLDNALDSIEKILGKLTDKKVNEKIKESKIEFKDGDKKTITKEEFNKMGYRSRMELYKNNKELYDKLSKN